MAMVSFVLGPQVKMPIPEFQLFRNPLLGNLLARKRYTDYSEKAEKTEKTLVKHQLAEKIEGQKREKTGDGDRWRKQDGKTVLIQGCQRHKSYNL